MLYKNSYTCAIRKKFLRKTNRELQFTLDKLLNTKEHYTSISMKSKSNCIWCFCIFLHDNINYQILFFFFFFEYVELLLKCVRICINNYGFPLATKNIFFSIRTCFFVKLLLKKLKKKLGLKMQTKFTMHSNKFEKKTQSDLKLALLLKRTSVHDWV